MNLDYMRKSVRNILNLCFLSFFFCSVTVKSFQKIMLPLSLKYSHFIERNLSLLRPIIDLLRICLIQILLQVSKESRIEGCVWGNIYTHIHTYLYTHIHTWENWDKQNRYNILKFGYFRLPKKNPLLFLLPDSELVGWPVFNWISYCWGSISWLMHVVGIPCT